MIWRSGSFTREFRKYERYCSRRKADSESIGRSLAFAYRDLRAASRCRIKHARQVADPHDFPQGVARAVDNSVGKEVALLPGRRCGACVHAGGAQAISVQAIVL